MVMIELNDEQQEAVARIKKVIAHGEHMTLHGLAGTGKTTVPATTIHGAFYDFVRRKPSKEGEPERLEFKLKHLPGSLRGRVVILDECSMCSRKIAREILSTGITVV